MRWWTHLYMGENASRNRVSILEGMRKGKMLVDTYVITLPESGNHILDILPVSLLTRQQRDGKDFLVLGIASRIAASKIHTSPWSQIRLTGAMTASRTPQRR